MSVKFEPHRAEHCRYQAENGALFCAGKTHRDLVLSAEAPYGFLYRIEDKAYASFNPYKYEWGNDDDWDFHTQLNLHAYIIRSVTPCGRTIKADNGNGYRFISKTTNKQFALPSIEQAVESYIARKKKQAAIYEARAQKARMCIEMASPEPRGLVASLLGA